MLLTKSPQIFSFSLFLALFMASNSPLKNLRLLQWNCLSLRQRKSQLLSISSDFDIILLCETWLNPPDHFSLKDFVIIRTDRLVGRGGGTAICVRRNIPFSPIRVYNSFFNLETTAISLSTCYGDLLVVSTYRPPNSPFNHTHLHNLLASISSFNSVFIAGDFNCHNVAWGSSSSCNLGDSLFNLFTDNDLLVINRGSPTYLNRRNPTNPSCIDLAFVSPHLYSLCSWSVLEDNFLSDHFPIAISLGIPPPSVAFNSHRPNYRRISPEDWTAFNLSLSSFSLNSLPPNLSAPAKYEVLTSSILNSINKISPPSPPPSSRRRKPPSPPWWNQDCSDAEAARKTALKNFRRDPNLFSELQAAEHAAKAIFRQAKLLSYQDACASLSPHSNPRAFWQLISRFRHRCLGPSQAHNNLANIQKQKDLIPSICPPLLLLPQLPQSLLSFLSHS